MKDSDGKKRLVRFPRPQGLYDPQYEYDYVTKPFSTRELEILVRRAIEGGRMHRRLTRAGGNTESDKGMVVGHNHKIQEILVFNKRYKKQVTRIDPSMMQMLISSPWKGNIRELENTIERAILLADGETITRDLVGFQSHDSTGAERDQRPLSLKEVVEETEKLAIQQVLAETDGNRTAAAKRLGIARRTLYDKMAAYALE